MEEKKYVVEIEKAKEAKEGKPSVGPVYRSVAAKHGFPPLLPGMETCWDIFRYHDFLWVNSTKSLKLNINYIYIYSLHATIVFSSLALCFLCSEILAILWLLALFIAHTYFIAANV